MIGYSVEVLRRRLRPGLCWKGEYPPTPPTPLEAAQEPPGAAGSLSRSLSRSLEPPRSCLEAARPPPGSRAATKLTRLSVPTPTGGRQILTAFWH